MTSRERNVLRSVRARLGARPAHAWLQRMGVSRRRGVDGSLLLVGLACARELGERDAYAHWLGLWPRVEGAYFSQVARECLLAFRAIPLEARALARAEVQRCPLDGRAHYLLARLIGGAEAVPHLHRALRAAEAPPRNGALSLAARVALAECGASVRFELEELEGLDDASRIALLRVGLASSRGYRRTAYVDGLADGVVGSDACSAAHLRELLDFAQQELPSALEWERIRAAAARFGGDKPRVVDRLWQVASGELRDGDLLCARAYLEGGEEKPEMQETLFDWALQSLESRAEGTEFPPKGPGLEAALALVEQRYRAGRSDAGTLADELMASPLRARRGFGRAAAAAAHANDLSRADKLDLRGVSEGDRLSEARTGEKERSAAWAAYERGDYKLAERLLTRAKRRLKG